MTTETTVLRGIIKTIKRPEGFAFITETITGQDYFMHRSAIAPASPAGWDDLVEDMVVDFTALASPKGSRAANVRVITPEEQTAEAVAAQARRAATAAAAAEAAEQARAASVEERRRALLQQRPRRRA